ncbi:MAG: hypothetical protein SVV80_06785 [Planctomycetota bacterium]|nr:hypothetical protein [Planctomycetota bacterium]
MKMTRLIAVLVVLATITIVTADASAMYHPTIGRFMQRDPGAGSAMRIGAGGAAPVGGFIPRDSLSAVPTRIGDAGPAPGGLSIHRDAMSGRPMRVGIAEAIVSKRFAQGNPVSRRQRLLGAVRPTMTGRTTQRNLWPSQYADGMNLYAYVRGNPLRWRDPSGLQIMICTRPAAWWTLGAKHAYLWDTTNNQSCGQSSSSGKGYPDDDSKYPDGGEPGPTGKGHTCHPVPKSDGKEKCVMGWCQKHMNDGIWFPLINDCHTKVKKALKECCLSDEGVPHPRF